MPNSQSAADWAKELEKLIDSAESAGSFDDRMSVSKRLRQFIRNSRSTDPNESDAIDDLDHMARVVAESMLIDDARERIQSIAARANDLAGLQKTLEDQAARNVASARSIRLENLRTAIGIATNLVESLNKVKGDWDENKEEEKEAKTKIDKAVKAVQDARNLMEHLGLGLG